MRVLLFPSAYAPHVGGVEQLTARLATVLEAEGDRVEVWAPRHPASLSAIERIDGRTVRRFVLPMPGRNPRNALAFAAEAPGTARGLLEAAGAFQPDIIHVQCFSVNGAWATWLAARLEVPLVVSLQGETVMDDHDIYDRSPVMRSALRWGLRRASAVTGCSEFVLKDARRRFGLDEHRGTVVYNGVDLGHDAEPETVPVPFSRFVLGVGRVVEKKGFDLLLDAFADVAAGDESLGLVIAGDGPARASLQTRARDLGLGDRVHFPGRMGRPQVAWLMENAETFCLPSRVEPFGIVVVEALQAGTPVVVTRHGGAREIVALAPDVGQVADPFDTAEFSSALSQVLARAAEVSTARAAKARAAEFAWDLIGREYRKIYGGACGV